MSDQFRDWRRLLEYVKPGMRRSDLRDALAKSGVAIAEDNPISGFYRGAAKKGGRMLPIAIWREDDKLFVLRDGVEVEPHKVWPWCVENPVPHDWYERATLGDGRWPDEAPIAADAPSLGHNNPPQDAAEDLAGQIESAAALAQGIKIADDNEAAGAQSLRSRLNELASAADKERAAEKKPHLDAGKAVDAKWQPIIKKAKDAANAIRALLGDYETAKLRADEARKAATLESSPVQTGVAATPKTTIKGASGRAAVVRTKSRAVVVDYDAAYAALRDDAAIRHAIEAAAQAAVDAGESVPGVTIEKIREVA